LAKRTKTKYRYVNRFKKRSFRKKKMTVPMLTVAGFIPGFANMHRAYTNKIHDSNASGFKNLSIEAGRIYLAFDSRVGADPKWSWQWLWEGSIPIILGAVGSKIASRLGINAKLARAGIPLIRV